MDRLRLTGYAVAQFFLAIVLIVLLVLWIVGGVLVVVWIGLGILTGCLVATRWIANLHREMAALPEGVVAHVLPTGGGLPGDDNLLSYRDFRGVLRRMDAAYTASTDYLEEHL